MKTAILALAAVVCGGIAGYGTAWWEFSGVTESRFDPAASKFEQVEGLAVGPRVRVVNGESHNFGTMERNTRGSRVFEIRNIGDAPLYVEKGDTTCKCTMSEMVDGSIPPGESIDVTLSWEVIDPPAGSKFRQVARIRTNDPNRPLIELLIHGYISRSIRAVPEELVVKRISANEETTASFRLYAYQHPDFEVTGHAFTREATREHFAVDFRPLTPSELAAEPQAQAGVAATVHILPGLPIGSLEQTLHIATSLPDNSELDIPLKGTVTSDISVVGRNFKERLNLLDLRTVRQSEGVTANLHVLVKGPYRDEVTLAVESTDPGDVLRATIGEADRSNPKIVRYPLMIEIPPGARQVSRLTFDPETAGRVVLQTTHPQAKQVRILVRFAVGG